MSATNLHDTTVLPPIRPTESKLFVPPAPRAEVELAGLTHPGSVRSNNEDNYAVIRRMRRQELLLTSQPVASFPAETDLRAFAADGRRDGRRRVWRVG